MNFNISLELTLFYKYILVIEPDMEKRLLKNRRRGKRAVIHWRVCVFHTWGTLSYSGRWTFYAGLIFRGRGLTSACYSGGNSIRGKSLCYNIGIYWTNKRNKEVFGNIGNNKKQTWTDVQLYIIPFNWILLQLVWTACFDVFKNFESKFKMTRNLKITTKRWINGFPNKTETVVVRWVAPNKTRHSRAKRILWGFIVLKYPHICQIEHSRPLSRKWLKKWAFGSYYRLLEI